MEFSRRAASRNLHPATSLRQRAGDGLVRTMACAHYEYRRGGARRSGERNPSRLVRVRPGCAVPHARAALPAPDARSRAYPLGLEVFAKSLSELDVNDG